MSTDMLVMASDIQCDVTCGGVEKCARILDSLMIVYRQEAGERRLRDILRVRRAGAEGGANVSTQIVPIALVQQLQASALVPIVDGGVEAAIETGRGCDAVERNAGHGWF